MSEREGVGCTGRFLLLFPGVLQWKRSRRGSVITARTPDSPFRLRAACAQKRFVLARGLRGCRDLRNFEAIAQLSGSMIDHSLSARKGLRESCSCTYTYKVFPFEDRCKIIFYQTFQLSRYSMYLYRSRNFPIYYHLFLEG